MSQRDARTLFSNQAMGDLKSSLRDRIRRDIKDEHSLYEYKGTQKERLLAKYSIRIPTITERKSTVSGDEIEHSISFTDANGTFFHHSPTKQTPHDKPTAYVISNALYIYFDRLDDTDELKKRIKAANEAFDAWFDLLKEEVEEYNRQLPSVIDSTIADYEAELKKQKDLEDELNS